VKHSQHLGSNIRLDCLQSSDEITQKAREVLVCLVQQLPSDGSPDTFRRPLAEQCAFAKASRGRDKRQPMVQDIIQLLKQAWLEDNFRTRWGL